MVHFVLQHQNDIFIQKNLLNLGEISSSHGGEYEDDSFLGCSAV
jgi:hypothetical protein